MSSFSSEIIIGIDFGTTYSAVSWAINPGSRNIRLINNWPGPFAQNASRDKVPSSISYANGKPKSWGYNVDLTDESFKWIKILLEENHENHEYRAAVKHVKDSNMLLGKIGKTAQAVVADYLRLLWEYALDDIHKKHPSYKDLFHMQVVLTVPAIWSPAEKEKTREAATIAGMPGDIKLVTEPEAAALATFKDKSEENTLKAGDVFVVCDAGGGTVELISYEVIDLNPLKIKECAVGSGGPCGSIFLDLRFEQHISTMVGEVEYHGIKESHRKNMIRQFEYGIKRSFSEHNNQEYSVDLKGLKEDPEFGIEEDAIKVNTSTLRAIFNPIALQIDKLIQDQIANSLDENNLTVKAILLVGGFGENQYLYDHLTASHANNGTQVMQVNGAWSSICRGATLWGLEHSDLEPITRNPTVASRISRYSYGITVSEVYDDYGHLLQDKYRDKIENLDRARNQMEWLLKKGDEVQNGRTFEISLNHTLDISWFDYGQERFSMTLYYNEEATPPTRWTAELATLCVVHYNLGCSKLRSEKSQSVTGTQGMYRCADIRVKILLHDANLEFFVTYKDEIVGSVVADYKQGFT